MQGMMQTAQQQMAPGDELLYVQFYNGSLQNAELTLEQGHPVFESVPMVRIMVPGDKNTIVDTRVSERHKRRFAALWAQFERNEEQTQSGMPIREWAAITRAQADELYHQNIVTVEQLAEVADVYGSKIMGFQDLKRKAKDYLTIAKDASAALKLSEQNKFLQDQVTALKAELARLSAAFDLKAELAQLPVATPKRRPGRPRKVTNADNGT